ncbi:Hypothetical protein POVR1_LOCUS546 [uncultured virus]|nr:Hypothetical protein POVR1_LOCUS546 [uncultured virus]
MKNGLTEGLGNLMFYIGLDMDMQHQIKINNLHVQNRVFRKALNDHMPIINFLQLADNHQDFDQRYLIILGGCQKTDSSV